MFLSALEYTGDSPTDWWNELEHLYVVYQSDTSNADPDDNTAQDVIDYYTFLSDVKKCIDFEPHPLSVDYMANNMRYAYLDAVALNAERFRNFVTKLKTQYPTGDIGWYGWPHISDLYRYASQFLGNDGPDYYYISRKKQLRAAYAGLRELVLPLPTGLTHTVIDAYKNLVEDPTREAYYTGLPIQIRESRRWGLPLWVFYCPYDFNGTMLANTEIEYDISIIRNMLSESHGDRIVWWDSRKAVNYSWAWLSAGSTVSV